MIADRNKVCDRLRSCDHMETSLKGRCLLLLLRIRSAHLVINLVSYGWSLLIHGYFARFKAVRGKQKLASAFGIQKENWG